jgi:CcmD family protein
VKISPISRRSSRRARLAVGLALVAIVALPGTVLAAASAQEAPGESNLGFLLVAEIVVWAGFFAYAFYMSRKTNEMRCEIDDLRAQLHHD